MPLGLRDRLDESEYWDPVTSTDDIRHRLTESPDYDDDVQRLDGVPPLLEGIGGPARAGAGILGRGASVVTGSSKAKSGGSLASRAASVPGAAKKADAGRRAGSLLTLGEAPTAENIADRIPEVPEFEVPDWDIELPGELEEEQHTGPSLESLVALAAAGVGAFVLLRGVSA